MLPIFLQKQYLIKTIIRTILSEERLSHRQLHLPICHAGKLPSDPKAADQLNAKYISGSQPQATDMTEKNLKAQYGSTVCQHQQYRINLSFYVSKGNHKP